jgi:hypothetical protein
MKWYGYLVYSGPKHPGGRGQISVDQCDKCLSLVPVTDSAKHTDWHLRTERRIREAARGNGTTIGTPP